MTASAYGTAARSRAVRRAVRAACVAAYLVLIAALFANGKGHVVLIDNKDAADGAYPALDYVLVGVDRGESVEYYPGDRDRAVVKGQNHRIRIELEDGTEKEFALKLPLLEEMTLVSVPLLLAGAEGAVSRFEPRDAVPPADDSIGNSNQFTAPGGPDAGDAPEAPPPAD